MVPIIIFFFINFSSISALLTVSKYDYHTFSIANYMLMGRWEQFKQYIKKQRHYFANKCPSSQSYGFSSSHIWMGELDCWGPAWGIPPMAKVMRKETWHMQRHDKASGNPLFPSIYPQNHSLPTLLFYALTYTSDFTGGWPPLPLSEKDLTYSSKSIKILGRDKSVSTYELLWSLSSLPVLVRLATCDCLQPPNRERHEMF